MSRKRSRPMSPRERRLLMKSERDEAARAAAALELARAMHHLDVTSSRKSNPKQRAADPRRALITTIQTEIDHALELGRSTAPALIRARKELARLERSGLVTPSEVETALGHLFARSLRRDDIGGAKSEIDPLLSVVRRARAALATASVMRRPTGDIMSRAAFELMALERAGTITAAESNTAFERIVAHYAFTHDEVKGMSNVHHIAVGADTDLPPELASYSDGITDDAAYHPEIIGCGLPALGVSGGLGDIAIGGGLGDIAIGRLPTYALTQKGLRNPVVRRRFAAAIERLTPKVRRRVLNRLKALAQHSLVSGAVRSAYPTVSGTNVGWSGITVGRCPYASVAGPLTP